MFPVKKINAIIGLLAVFSLVCHAATMAYTLATGYYNPFINKNLAYSTAILVSIHVVLVLLVFFFFQDASNLKGNVKLNAQTIEQRLSGILILIFLHAHVQDYKFIMSGETPNKVKIIIFEFLFFTSICSHVVTSFSKLWITLGVIQSEKTKNIIDRIVSTVCLVFLVGIMVLLIRFLGAYGV